jgi:DNA-binding NarL/FixJ family response regulator
VVVVARGIAPLTRIRVLSRFWLGADVPPIPSTIRVTVADDAYLVREALARIVAGFEGIELLATCADATALRSALEAQAPDVLVTDIRMPPSGLDEGIRIAQLARRRWPAMGVVVLSQYADFRYGRGLVEGGAHGRAYLLKDRVHDGAQLRAAIEAVARGGSIIDPEVVEQLLDAEQARERSSLADLTAREREVLSLMAQGRSNANIAETLVLTKRAVEKHVGAIFFKLRLPDEAIVSRRVAAVLAYLDEPR